MYSVSNAFHSAATANTRQIVVKALFNDSLWLTGDNLINMTITEAVNASDGISMGATISSKLELTFKMPETTLPLSGGWVQPYVGFYGIDEYCPLGKFYITEANSKGDSFTITAYDGFSKTEERYTPQIEMPNTAEAILKDIASQCGFSLDANNVGASGIVILSDLPTLNSEGILIFSNAPTLDDDGVLIFAEDFEYPEGMFELYDFTCRQYIGYFAGLLGKNAKFNRQGSLVFSWYNNADCNISSNLQYMDGFKRLTDKAFVVQSISSGSSDAMVTSGSGFGISFENPFMTQERLDEIAATIGKPAFTPAEVKWRGNPAIEAGDIIRAEDKAGEFHTVYVMEQILKIGSGLHSEIKCFGKSEAAIQFGTSPQAKKLQQVYTKLQEAITEATTLLNGANGGVFEVLDEDGDGINDGWIIHSADQQKFIKANLNGIGITTDGGATYEQAMTANGINASAINTGTMNAQRINVGDAVLGDVFSVDTDENGHPIVTIGASDSDIKQKQTNDAITFVNGNEDTVARFSITGAEWADMQQMKYCGFLWTKSSITGNVRFTKGGE